MPTMAEAIDEALPLAKSAAEQGAKIIFLPEYAGGLKSEGRRIAPPSSHEDTHEFLNTMRGFARDNGVWVQVGSVAIDGPDGKLINRGFMLDDQGEISARYDKIHLFDVDLAEGAVYRESDTVCSGGEAVVYATPFANIGHTICYDLRFPGLFRDLAQAGAEILCCPAAFTKMTGEAHWHILNRARAIENTRFVVSACAVGDVPGGGQTYGHSLIIDPWGKVLADGGAEPGIICAEIDLDLVQETASKVPSLTHDRDYSKPNDRSLI